jgi:tryptophan synthase alpha chain
MAKVANRIDQTFRRLKQKRGKALIGYVTAGFPSKKGFVSLLLDLEQAGLDLVEIGVPFSDPIADGPVIQNASQAALANGVTVPWILDTVHRLRYYTDMPVILMSYANPILAYGPERFFTDAQKAGVDGLIVPDLIVEEAGLFTRAATAAGIKLIHLVSPTTPVPRRAMIAQKTRGFLYAVSLTGVTGTRQALPSGLPKFIQSLKTVSPVPVAVGFGISTPDQARAVASYADAVIVGSALIRELGRSKKSAVRFIQTLKGAIDAS